MLCLGDWCRLNFIKDDDLKEAASKPEVRDNEAVDDEEGWN